MKQRWVVWGIGLLLFLVTLSPVAVLGAEIQAEADGERGVEAAAEALEVNELYVAYGFLFEQYDRHDRYGRFTAHEITVLGRVIEAYAELAGGPERLSALVGGPVRVRRDLQEVVSYTQAGQVIGLGRGAFDLALTEESNFYTWGANDGDELAQIVFGHEIGHRWIETLRRQNDQDLGQVYGRNVPRGERASARESWSVAGGDPVDPEEEAVTNLALYVLDKEYRWTFLHDAPATEWRQTWVDGWVWDLLAGSRLS